MPLLLLQYQSHLGKGQKDKFAPSVMSRAETAAVSTWQSREWALAGNSILASFDFTGEVHPTV